jgi:hypothetical protein
MGKSVTIGEHTFASQKSVETFIRTLINETDRYLKSKTD